MPAALRHTKARAPSVNDTSAGDAPYDATYVVMSLDPTLINERVLTAGTGGISLTDGGAGGNATLDNTLTGANVGAGTGLIFRDKTAGPDVLNMKSLVGGSDITVTNGADDITIAYSGVSPAPVNASFVVMSLDGTLSDERVLTAGTGGISLTDGGAGGNATLDNTLTGANVGAGTGLIFRDKTAGPDVLNMKSIIGGTDISITNGADDITINYSGSPAPDSASYVVMGLDGTLSNERVLTAGSNINITDGGAGGNVTIATTGVPTGSGTINRVPLWTGASTLGDSLIESDGSTYTSIGHSANDIYVDHSSGYVGFREFSPVTLIEITNIVPYMTFHNSTQEDTDGGRESRIYFRGETSAATEHVLGMMEFSHNGTATDQKGRFVLYINDGSDGTSPSEYLNVAVNISGGTPYWKYKDPDIALSANQQSAFGMESDEWVRVRPYTIGGDGGARIDAAYTGSGIRTFSINCYTENESSVASSGSVIITSYKHNGAGGTTTLADTTPLVLIANGTTLGFRFKIYGEGSFEQHDTVNIAHGVTTYLPTSAYSRFEKRDSTRGGLRIIGANDSGVYSALEMFGITAGGCSAYDVVSFRAALASGTGITDCASDQECFVWYNNSTVLKLIEGNGNWYQPASTYHNWSSTIGSVGYGFRDSSGFIQFKHSGDDWVDINGTRVVALSDAATIAVDASNGNGLYEVTLGGNRTLGNPTGVRGNGQKIIFRVWQDGTGSRTLSFDSAYRFSTDLPSPTLTTAAGDYDYLAFIYNSTDSVWDFVGKVFGFAS